MKLYIFNPDTDLALANNRENYMPPARVKQMTKELELLPLWYAEDSSCIFTLLISWKKSSRKSVLTASCWHLADKLL